MAINFLSTRTGVAAQGAGANHVAYISGLDNHSEKNEVKLVIDKLIPASVAKDGKAFFEQADLLERANGRSFRSLVIAIPREATDQTKWTLDFVDDLLKDKHAYRVAIHDKGDGNPHAHLMFSERGLIEGATAKDFFSRKNPKPAHVSSMKDSAQWLVDAKALHLTHVRKVAPDFTPSPVVPISEKRQRTHDLCVKILAEGEPVLANIERKIAKLEKSMDDTSIAFANKFRPQARPRAFARHRVSQTRTVKTRQARSYGDILTMMAKYHAIQKRENERIAQEQFEANLRLHEEIRLNEQARFEQAPTVGQRMDQMIERVKAASKPVLYPIPTPFGTVFRPK